MLILTSLEITFACTGEVVDPTPQLHASISTPSCRHRFLFEGKGQAKKLKQVFLERQPKHFIAFKKKMLFLSLPPFPFSPITCLFPPLGLYICAFH